MFENKLVGQFQQGGVTLDMAPADARVAYLKKVFALTFGGLFIAGVVGTASAFMLMHAPPVFHSRPMQFILILGPMFFANIVCAGMVQRRSTAMLGFILANIAEGVALGYLLLTAAAFGMAKAGDPTLVIGQALGLTLMVTLGLTAYVWTNPSEFRWASAIMSALGLPLLILMVLSFVWPIGGTFGIIISLVFVGVSCLGLLTSVRDVLHGLSEDQAVPGAFILSMSIVTLFWNLLVLLMKLQSRD